MSAMRTPLLSLVLTGALASFAAAAEMHVLEEGSPEKITGLGNEALMQGRYETAIEHYRKALDRQKDYYYAQFNLALAYQQINQLDEAKRWYEEALKSSGDNPQVLCNLGFLAFRTGNYIEAVAKFEDAARISAHHPQESSDYWYNAGSARERLQQWRDARLAYEECLALNDNHFAAHFNLGTLYLGPLGNTPSSLDQAESHLNKAKTIDPNRPEAWMNLALCFERNGKSDPEAAFAEAVRVASAAQQNTVRWQRLLYFNRIKPPKKVAMRDDLKFILAADPDFAEANGYIGTYLYSIADFDTAIVHLEREIEGKHFDIKCPTDQDAHYLLALIYTDHRPDPAKALKHAEAFYQLHPDSAKIHELRRRAIRLSNTTH
jgi:tetratricopeptide (TPR) repeat protein